MLLALLLGCSAEPTAEPPVEEVAADWPAFGKADSVQPQRLVEVLLTAPHCDVCSPEDKALLRERSPIIQRVVELIEGARDQVEVAQFTFSVQEIELALVAAHERGVKVRLAMDTGQDRDGSVSRRLAAAGVDVRFIAGRDAGRFQGLQHAKFMRVDGRTLVMGSNNWSSTGTTINEENTMVVEGASGDPLVDAFGCYFEVVWSQGHESAAVCNTDEVAFTPGTSGIRMLKTALRGAERSIDVLMHHLVFDDLVKELAKAAERGVQVRVIVNAADQAEHANGKWPRLLAAGGQIRFKQSNPGLYQLMHHKLVVVDDRLLINGSGNWSGSAFFNNFEFYVSSLEPATVATFAQRFRLLWTWSLSAESLGLGRSAAQQHASTLKTWFGSLHAHFSARDAAGRLLDDGLAERLSPQGDVEPVDVGSTLADAARHAWEYARDVGGLDFMALSPHTMDERSDDTADIPNMSREGFASLQAVAKDLNGAANGEFVALPAMEWSTNSRGNHVGILGSTELCKLERGRFDLLYDEFLPTRSRAGDKPILQLNHPRTFRHYLESLEGNWDQVFDVSLSEIPKTGQRTKKFNDFGLDDYPPLAAVRQAWIDGQSLPDPAVVDATLAVIEEVSRPYMRLLEVLVARGKELGGEGRQNPSLSTNEAGLVERYTKVHTDWDYYLRKGFRLAPVANHDNHRANWGAGHSSRTGILAETLSERSIFQALDERMVFASEDENLELRLYAEGRVPMGGLLATSHGEVELSALVQDPDLPGPFELRVYSGRVGGETVEPVTTLSNVADGVWSKLSVPLEGVGRHFVYLEVWQPSVDRMAWSAPIWIDRL